MPSRNVYYRISTALEGTDRYTVLQVLTLYYWFRQCMIIHYFTYRVARQINPAVSEKNKIVTNLKIVFYQALYSNTGVSVPGVYSRPLWSTAL